MHAARAGPAAGCCARSPSRTPCPVVALARFIASAGEGAPKKRHFIPTRAARPGRKQKARAVYVGGSAGQRAARLPVCARAAWHGFMRGPRRRRAHDARPPLRAARRAGATVVDICLQWGVAPCNPLPFPSRRRHRWARRGTGEGSGWMMRIAAFVHAVQGCVLVKRTTGGMTFGRVKRLTHVS